MRAFFRRVGAATAKWGPWGIGAAFLAREASHGFHLHAPHTLALCLLPPAVACTCRWCVRRWRRFRKGGPCG